MASKKKPNATPDLTEALTAMETPEPVVNKNNAKKGMSMLAKLAGAVKERADPTQNVLRAPTPALRYIFGKGGGLPFGYSAIFAGAPKGGKSLLAMAMVGALHQQDPTAICLWYSTEHRGQLQLSDEMMAAFNIDPSRIQIVENNEPTIFDDIRDMVPAAIQEGANVRLLVIDSLNGVQGVREQNRESIVKQQIGDNARTLQEGMKSILGVIRKYSIAFIGISQVRAEMDQAEIMRGNTQKIALSYGAKHLMEYNIMVQRWLAKDGRTTILGEEFKNDAEELTGHKIVVKNNDSSIGYGGGRKANVTVDYRKGLINTYEETFDLGVRTGMITSPSQGRYRVEGRDYHGKAAILAALRDDKMLAEEVNRKLLKRDLEAISDEQREQRNEVENAPTVTIAASDDDFSLD